MTPYEYQQQTIQLYRERLKDAIGDAERKYLQQTIDQLSGKVVTKITFGVSSLN